MAGDLWAKDGGVYFGFPVTPAKPSPEQSILDEAWNVDSAVAHSYPNPRDPNNSGDRHLLTIGPNGSGKTRRLLIPNLFRLKNWSSVVVDVKGELAAYTAAYRASQKGHRVVVIDPFGVMQRNYPKLAATHSFLTSTGFNPIAALDPAREEFPDDATALAEAMIRVEGNEPHWSQSAQDLLTALIMYVRIARPGASLEHVRKILGLPNDGLRGTIRLAMEVGISEDCEELTIKAGRFSDIRSENRELNSIVSTALTQTRWLDSRPIKADLSKGAFDFGTLKEKPTTVYLILPPRHLATHSTWLRVLITSCLMPLLRSVEDAKVPVLFALDEFAQLGKMQVIEDNIALLRGYGVKLWPILQDLAQIRHLYSERWESFIGNSGVVQSFAPQDQTTRDYLSKLSGQRLYWIKTGSTSDNTSRGREASHSSGTTESMQYMPGPVYWQQGLGAMDTGQGVLFARGKCRRAYFPDPEDPADVLGLRNIMATAKGSFS